MTYAELVDAVTRLPTEERLALLEAIARSLRMEERPAAATSTGAIRGLFRADGPPPDDTEVDALYGDYLADKYR